MSSPRWYIRNFDDREARMVHLSYHDEEHYNSVRLKDDTCAGPARPIIIKADANPSENSLQGKVLATCSQKRGDSAINPGIIKLVMAGSGCENAEKIEKVIVQVDGDVDAAIEFLVAEQGAEEPEEPIESSMCHIDSSVDVEIKNCEQLQKHAVEKHDKVDSSSNHIKNTNCSGPQPDDKRIPRNKVCPCGSKKKYKACCGSVAGRSSAKYIINKTVDSKKTRKERKMGKKGGPATVEVTSGPDGLPHDMEALYI